MKAYRQRISQKERQERCQQLRDSGKTVQEIARIEGLSESYVRNITKADSGNPQNICYRFPDTMKDPMLISDVLRESLADARATEETSPDKRLPEDNRAFLQLLNDPDWTSDPWAVRQAATFYRKQLIKAVTFVPAYDENAGLMRVCMTLSDSLCISPTRPVFPISEIKTFQKPFQYFSTRENHRMRKRHNRALKGALDFLEHKSTLSDDQKRLGCPTTTRGRCALDKYIHTDWQDELRLNLLKEIIRLLLPPKERGESYLFIPNSDGVFIE